MFFWLRTPAVVSCSFLASQGLARTTFLNKSNQQQNNHEYWFKKYKFLCDIFILMLPSLLFYPIFVVIFCAITLLYEICVLFFFLKVSFTHFYISNA